MGKSLSGAEEVSDDGLTLDQLEVLLRRGHRVGPGRGLPKPLLDSPLGIIPERNVLIILAFSVDGMCTCIPVIVVGDFASLPEHLLVQGQHGA